MATALQCPACGHKHRLSGLSGEPVFACEQCGRLLKTPAEYLRPGPSGPAGPPRPTAGARVQRGGAAARDQTSVLPSGAPSGARPRRPGPKPPVPVPLPLRILAWVVAVVLGAYIVRWIARAIGWLTGDSLIDIITGSGIGRYLRIFALVPFWALATALLATLFIEGGRSLARRRRLGPSRAARPARPPARPAPSPRKTRPAPRQPAPRAPAPEPVAAERRIRVQKPPAEPRAPRPSPAATEAPSPTGTTGPKRPRNIPRRDVSS